MRVTVLLGAGVALMIAGAAGAQTPGAPYPQPGRQVVPGPGVHHPRLPQPPRVGQPVRPSRWGGHVGGRWWGGVNAPGGWAAYRQPHRGYRVPQYWVAPRFYISDWQGYGLSQPLAGYNWVRYYDDAVMIDRGGSVYDVRSGVDWDGAGYAPDYAAAPPPPPPPPIDDRNYRDVPVAPDGPPPPPMRYDRRERRDVVMHDDRRGPPPSYPAGPSSWRSPDGRTTVTTTVTGGGTPPVIVAPGYAGGYGYGGGYYGGGVTTITVQSAPVVTTTTEIYEDVVTYSRPVIRRAVRRVHRAPVRHRARPRCVCR